MEIINRGNKIRHMKEIETKREHLLKVTTNLAKNVSPYLNIKLNKFSRDKIELSYKDINIGVFTFSESWNFLRGLDWGMIKCKTNRKKLVRYILGRNKLGKLKFNSNLMIPLHPVRMTVKMKI